ncbi:hypothetical protein V1525DRAFT_424428 [Lipomyces kononenkoae]|uniref:Uncharacterized protein n=1 Tax=Lipomyces kononenkoae TaxID=34357 RepID=A0ACC3T8F8_LIPKO
MDHDEELVDAIYSPADNHLAATQVIQDTQDATVNENKPWSFEQKVGLLQAENEDELDDVDIGSNASTEDTRDWNYNVNYLALLNYEIEEFVNPISRLRRTMIKEQDRSRDELIRSRFPGESASLSPMNASIIGSRVHWSSEEKELFFEYLGRRSRHDPVGISRGVGTKSPVECAEYITVLEQGLQRVRTKEQRRRMPGMRLRYKRVMKRIPAARKMSRRWIRFEETESRRLENYTEIRSRLNERRAWLRSLAAAHDQRPQSAIEVDSEACGASKDEIKRIFGRVDNYCADLIRRECMAHPDDRYFDRLGERIALECTLLNIEKMLEISLRLYYQQENLSRSVTEYLHRHAFLFSTIRLFHGLVRQFTRRLVTTTLTVAQTRLHVSDHAALHRQPVVHRQDVEAACAVVGAEPNADRFWIGFKRRNDGLRITEPQTHSLREVDAEKAAELLSVPIARRR